MPMSMTISVTVAATAAVTISIAISVTIPVAAGVSAAAISPGIATAAATAAGISITSAADSSGNNHIAGLSRNSAIASIATAVAVHGPADPRVAAIVSGGRIRI